MEFDSKLLVEKTTKRGVSFKDLADCCDFSLATFYNKLHSGEFKRDEISAIANKLKLSRTDILRIFFAM